MNKITIIADSTCDLGEAYQTEYDIRVLPGHVVFPDGREMLSSFRWADFGGREAFYEALKKDPDGFKTSPPNVAEFEAAFTREVEAGNSVIAMTISGGISGAFDFAQSARNNLLQTHPQAQIACIDTRRFGPGFGLMVLYAARLRAEGKGFEAIVSALEENKNRFHQAGWLDDLSFVAKKGRITHPKAFLGRLAGIKPIGEFDSNGLTTVIGKVKGAKNAYDLLLHYIEQTAEAPEEQIFLIAQTNRLPQAQEFQARIEARFHPAKIVIQDVFPPCGINVGPGLMAAYYMGKPISEGLEEEKKILMKFCGE